MAAKKETPKAEITKAKEEEPVVEAEVVEVPIEPIFWSGIFPVFIMETNESLEKIKATGHNNCFILARMEEKKEGAGNTSVYRDAVFQMSNNPTSFGLSEVAFSSLDIKGILKETAFLKTPKMPWQFVAKMDLFFRAAHEKYGTESIVMLTYDNDYFGTEDPGAGWDFYVPTQTNTSVDCDYKKDEVLAELEGTNKSLMGSAHSHPEMSAFFSNTDHDDQADWPGLHITFAWNKGSKVSSHHVELIQNGKTWTYSDLRSVFEEPPLPELKYDFATVLEDKVDIKKPPAVTTLGYQPGFGGAAGTGSGVVGTNRGTVAHSRELLKGTNRVHKNTGPAIKKAPIFMPENAPDLRDNIIVARIAADNRSCAFCSAPITEKMKSYSSCYACGGLFIYETEDGLKALVDQRKMNGLDVSLLEQSGADELPHPIFLWDRKLENNEIVNEFVLVGGGDESTPKA